jgi:hypothetical protein
VLQALLAGTVQALQEEVPGLGETVAFAVKHLYAWVKENNLRVYVKDRYCKDQQPRGDPDCCVGVKRSTNQEQPDSSTKEKKGLSLRDACRKLFHVPGQFSFYRQP